MNPQLPKSRPGARVWALGLLIFVAGAIAGAASGTLYLKYQVEHRFRHPDRVFDEMIERIEHDLALTPGQTNQIRLIMEEKKKEALKMIGEFHPRIEAHFESLKEAIRPTLDPQQAQQWDLEFERMRESFLPPRLPVEADLKKLP